MMLRTFLFTATLSAATALSVAPASAMPINGAAIDVPAVHNVQWYYHDDDGPRWRQWHRRGPPPWAPAWGRRHRDRYVYRYRHVEPRYRTWGYHDDGPYYHRRRPGVTFRFGFD